MISGASSASWPAAACSRCSFAIPEGRGVISIALRGGVRSHPANVSPKTAASFTGSDMAPQLADPDER
jgi:hypothetical protein